MNFKLGDVVKVKGTEIKMTINKLDSYANDVECLWFEGSVLHRSWFSAECLEVAK